jgi:multiple sugar transport system ATP-binding protein
MAEVILRQVTKVFDKGVVAVKDVDIDVADKEFLVLVGPSGCGKSTTLRMIAGLEEITEGEIYIDGRLVNDVPPKDRDIAMVFQTYALYPHMTVYQNMAFGLKLRRYPKADIEERVKEAAEILGITNLLARKPSELSGGQRQRVAVGRAIVRHPKVFLFDEPLSNLDAKMRVQMRTEISKLHFRLEATMIYVTHDQVEAMTMGDRIVVMRDGIIQQTDSPLGLYDKPANRFVAGFIGSPAMNFLEGTLRRNEGIIFHDGNVDITMARKYDQYLHDHIGREVVFGIRPEDIYLAELSEGAVDKADVRAKVEVVEPMGNEIYLYLTTGPSSLVARIHAARMPRVGDEVQLVFDISKSHFFDKVTERRLL